MTKRVSRAEAVDTILVDLLRLRDMAPYDKPIIVTVTGGSATGKGHLIDELAHKLATFGKRRASSAVLTLDDYYIGRARMAAEGVPHFDHPRAVDLALAAEHLASMRVPKTVKIPKYDFASGERVGEQEFGVALYVLVDGLFAAYAPEIRALSSYNVFVDSDHYSTMMRRLFRDAGPDGRTKQLSSEVLDMYFRTVWPAKRQFIDPTAQHADVIVETSYDPASEALRAGPMQYSLKARGMRSDDAIKSLVNGIRLGTNQRQTDRFLRPRRRTDGGEILRLRVEGGHVFLTYKGPLVPSTTGVGGRPCTSPIPLGSEQIVTIPGTEDRADVSGYEAMRWSKDDYDIEATLSKTRTLYLADGLVIACDRTESMGNWIEVRTHEEHRRVDLVRTLTKLCPGEPVTDHSYLDLWRRRRSGEFAVPTPLET